MLMEISSNYRELRSTYLEKMQAEQKGVAGASDFVQYLQETKKAAGTDLIQTGAYAGYINNISRAYSTGKPDASNFEDAFPQYDVVTHVGSTEVSSANWQRNDFLFWKYFDKNATADCLNDWKASGSNPPQTRADIQRGVSSIGPGKMALLIPDGLQEKMDADEDFARQVMAKVQKWKEDYDRRDNALAASYGYNVAAYQAEKSYCLQLDENGDVVNATVCGGGGRITRSSDEMVKAYYRRREKQAEYEQIAEENAIKRKLQEQEADRAYYQKRFGKETVLAAYQANFLSSDTGIL